MIVFVVFLLEHLIALSGMATELSVCELLRAPDRYHGKEVIVIAEFGPGGGIEPTTSLIPHECVLSYTPKEEWIDAIFVGPISPVVWTTSKGKRLRVLVERRIKRPKLGKLIVTVTGIFESEYPRNGYGNMQAYMARIRITRVNALKWKNLKRQW